MISNSETKITSITSFKSKCHSNRFQFKCFGKWVKERKQCNTYSWILNIQNDRLTIVNENQQKVRYGIGGRSSLLSAKNGLEQVVQAFADAVSVVTPLTVKSSTNIVDCCTCLKVMLEPVTLPCGHTFCKKCASKCDSLPSNSEMSLKLECSICNALYDPSNLKTNVVIARVIEKWWPDVKQAALLVKEGQNHLEKDLDETISKYKKALDLDPQDHCSAIELSEILLNAGRAEESLNYADIAIKSKNHAGKNFFMKASALVSLGRYEESIISYLYCLHFNFNVAEVKKEIFKLLQKLVQQCQLCQRGSSITNCNQSSKDDLFDVKMSNFDSKVHESQISNQTLQYSHSVKNKNYVQHLKKRETEKLQKLIDHCMQQIGVINSSSTGTCSWDTKIRPLIVENVNKQDLECPLCMRLLWEPVTTPCGHMYCRTCLDRSLDHQILCPLCKSSLEEYLAERRQATTEVVELTIQNFLHEEATERKKAHEEEMMDLQSGADSMQDVPLFICTIAFPTVPCPLHIFEPRYRLMTRQCMESGSKTFGMCAALPEAENGITTYGTTLVIRDMHFLPDGRSIVDTIGGKRFKVIKIGMRDGYHIGSIEYITDEEVESDSEAATELKVMGDYVYYTSGVWFESLPIEIQQEINRHFGPRPTLDMDSPSSQPNGPAWFWWLVAVLPLEKQLKMSLLGMTSLRKRLEVVYRVIEYLQSNRPM